MMMRPDCFLHRREPIRSQLVMIMHPSNQFHSHNNGKHTNSCHENGVEKLKNILHQRFLPVSLPFPHHPSSFLITLNTWISVNISTPSSFTPSFCTSPQQRQYYPTTKSVTLSMST
eukprot:TRINITY_DN8445_c0_g1_i1.p1 TRINITY_DN8445_c0_g1~~TRINITY_DN8445_c0_g1_i1.p1  ORF type:complete len:116 (-),score=11.58 TRINITY_DN8445_c0_g1_i1:170-517(-)